MYRRHYGVGASLHAVLESNVNFMNTVRLAHLNNSKIILIISVNSGPLLTCYWLYISAYLGCYHHLF